MVCFFGGSSRAAHGRTLGAVWCRGARCPWELKVKGFCGSEVWLSLGGLHTHFCLDTHDTPAKFVDAFSIEKGDISYL